MKIHFCSTLEWSIARFTKCFCSLYWVQSTHYTHSLPTTMFRLYLAHNRTYDNKHMGQLDHAYAVHLILSMCTLPISVHIHFLQQPLSGLPFISYILYILPGKRKTIFNAYNLTNNFHANLHTYKC